MTPIFINSRRQRRYIDNIQRRYDAEADNLGIITPDSDGTYTLRSVGGKNNVNFTFATTVSYD
ncbi:hypothetical protein CCP2SC5_2110003 [Azospirillaceae bacterium]